MHWLCVFIMSNIRLEWIFTLILHEYQGTTCSKQAPNLKICDCDGTWTHKHLVCNETFNHLAKLAKWMSCVVSTYLYGKLNWIVFLSSKLNHLASYTKWLCDDLQTKWSWMWVPLQPINLQICQLFWASISSTFRSLQSVDSR